MTQEQISKISYSLKNLSIISNRIISITNSKVLCFKGNMGTGKTTLIKSLANKLGSVDSIKSPSFSIVNTYYSLDGEILAYHFDCYRLESLDEALDFGIDEYFKPNVWIFVEWPEIIDSILPVFRTEIDLEYISKNKRLLTIKSIF